MVPDLIRIMENPALLHELKKDASYILMHASERNTSLKFKEKKNVCNGLEHHNNDFIECRVTGSKMNHRSEASTNIQTSVGDSQTSDSHTGNSNSPVEEDVQHVALRSNSKQKSLRRKEVTDTAIISNVFNFLPIDLDVISRGNEQSHSTDITSLERSDTNSGTGEQISYDLSGSLKYENTDLTCVMHNVQIQDTQQNTKVTCSSCVLTESDQLQCEINKIKVRGTVPSTFEDSEELCGVATHSDIENNESHNADGNITIPENSNNSDLIQSSAMDLTQSDAKDLIQASASDFTQSLARDQNRDSGFDSANADVKGDIIRQHRETEIGENMPTCDVKMRKSHLSRQESLDLTEQDSKEENESYDSSDEDIGLYDESFRRSKWIRIDDDGKLEIALPAVESVTSLSYNSLSSKTSNSLSTDVTDSDDATVDSRSSSNLEEVFSASISPRPFVSHKRSDSTCTTQSEKEFKHEYFSRRKCLIQRHQSSKEYHRYSARVYDQDKTVVMEKNSTESDYGIHILDSQPAFITTVDPGSPAERAGIQEGQIIVSVNGVNVLTASHDSIINLLANNPMKVHLEVATSDIQPSRDLQAHILAGYMHKLGQSSFMRLWKKRYFVLRQDGCLYYYKHKEETDPLGAIPLTGYNISRYLDSGRDYCFKAEKYGARTYYFMSENRDEMTEWVVALMEAAARCKMRKESFMSVSSHNVGIPALDVRRPECTGYLQKVGNRHKTWHRRYCVLKDACLYYYKNMNSLNALGVVHLHGYNVTGSVSVGKKHAFGAIPPDESLRKFYFSAENETDKKRWMDSMTRSIERWIQIDNDC